MGKGDHFKRNHSSDSRWKHGKSSGNSKKSQQRQELADFNSSFLNGPYWNHKFSRTTENSAQ